MQRIRKFFFLLFTFLLVLGTLGYLSIKPMSASYSVSGYIFNDLNANRVYDFGEPNLSKNDIPSVYVYADNTQTVYRAEPDGSGYWHIDNLPEGPHSIEIANAGSAGGYPTTNEKVTVYVQRLDVRFGIQQGYTVVGRVTDDRGGVPGLTVYVDLPNRRSAATDSFGNYRIENVAYGGSGHNIYIQDGGSWQVVSQNPILLTPQSPVAEMRADFRVRNVDSEARSLLPPPISFPPPPQPTFPTPTPVPLPVQATASCAVGLRYQSGFTSPVTIQLAANFAATNPDFRPTRYDWDFQGDGFFDNSTYTNVTTNVESANFDLTTPAAFTTSYYPRLRVYYGPGGAYSVECVASQPAVVNPAQTPTPFSTPTPYTPSPIGQITSAVNIYSMSRPERYILSVTLFGTSSSPNATVYYPEHYDWDFNGDGITDAITSTNNFSTLSPEWRFSITTASPLYFVPRLKVYYRGSFLPAESVSPRPITFDPRNPCGSITGSGCESLFSQETQPTASTYSSFEEILQSQSPQPQHIPSPQGHFCGGFAANLPEYQCPQGFRCQLDGNYPDASGTCVRDEILRTNNTTGTTTSSSYTSSFEDLLRSEGIGPHYSSL